MNQPIIEESSSRIIGTQFEQLCNETLKDVTGPAVQVVAKVRDYHSQMLKLSQVEARQPRFNFWEEGSQHQKILWGALKATMQTQDYKEFFQCWNFLLRAAEVLKDSTFSIIKLNQYSEGWRQSQVQLREYQGLVHLITMTSNPATRKEKVKEVDF